MSNLVEESPEGRPANRRPSATARSARRNRGGRIKAAVLCALLVIATILGIAVAPGIASADAPPSSVNGGGGPGLP